MSHSSEESRATLSVGETNKTNDNAANEDLPSASSVQ